MRKNHSRIAPDERREKLLTVALRQARRVGYRNLKRQDIAAEAGVTAPLLTHYFGTMAALERLVVRKAIRENDYVVIAQGLVNRDRRFSRVDDATKEAARATL